MYFKKYSTSFRLLFLVLVCAVVASCSYNKFTERQYTYALSQEPYDVVIVPGVPYSDENLGSVLTARILWSKYLIDSGITKHVIYSGAAVATPYIEGKYMKIYADSIGINPSLTFSETKAEHSTENAYYGWQMAKKMGFKKIALASDPFQTRSLRRFLKKRCENMAIIPIVFKRIDPTQNRQIKLPAIDPSSAYVPNFIPLSDREGFFERLRGTYGKHIAY